MYPRPLGEVGPVQDGVCRPRRIKENLSIQLYPSIKVLPLRANITETYMEFPARFYIFEYLHKILNFEIISKYQFSGHKFPVFDNNSLRWQCWGGGWPCTSENFKDPRGGLIFRGGAFILEGLVMEGFTG